MKVLVLLVVLLKCVLILSQRTSRCHLYNKFGLKNFDDEFYHFNSRCGYTLAQFTNNNDNDEVIVKLTNDVIHITTGTKKYQLKRSANKQPAFVSEAKTHNLPARENDIEVISPGTYVTAKFTNLGFVVQWDKKESIIIDVDTDKNSNLNGICSSTNFLDVNQWSDPAGCMSAELSCSQTDTDNSKRYCKQLLNKKQVECLRKFPQTTINSFLTVCAVTHCNCKLPDKKNCICPILQAFSKACSNKLDQPVEWRRPDLCPITTCPAGQNYMECGRRQKACGEPDGTTATEPKCIEGCVCPLNLYFDGTKCIPVTECPCYYDGNTYKPTQTVKQDCKICTCDHNNIWNCPGPVCMEEAVVWGDPHYTTFDKKVFDFMGKCTYYLVKGIDFNIKTDHYVWQHGKFMKNYQSTLPSWIKVLYLEYNNHVVSLKPGPGVIVDGVPLNQFPYVIPGFTISKPATNKVIVQLSNLVEVHWDGDSTVKIRVPVTMRGRLAGLLGNFNKKPNDDFMLPDGTQAYDANQFGHSWVVEGSCENENTDPVPHPCQANPMQKEIAQKACASLKTALFTNCKEYDPKLSYESCVYDCCITGAREGEKCSCTNLAQYADKCRIQQWRKSVPACEIPCPSGQIYNYCINPCESSCDYLNLNNECNKVCIEGCSCPNGQIFNEENKCVPIEKCKCKLNGKYFPAGFSYTKEKTTIETCSKGKWSSLKLNPTHSKNDIPPLRNCNEMSNSGYTPCKNPNALTCLNMHNYEKKAIQNCEDGCECNDGFVLDSVANMCVKPENCPCFYNGQSYKDNAVRRDFMQKCICINKKWNCSPYETRIDKCSIFGDTHIRNLDGKLISFKSTCEYVLAKATLDRTTFTITTQDGDITVTYSGVDGKIMKLNVKKDGSMFDELSHVDDFKSSKIGELGDIGIKFVWNHEGWFHISFDNKWNNKIEGLCARLEHPYQPLTTNDLKNFTDYWSVDLTCFDISYYDTTNEIFTNDDKPLQTKCELLKDTMFKPCNDEVSVVDYYNKCLVTARDFLQNEDEDGAEKFYCQIFSAFAQECNDVGLPVNWRSKNQCPFTCTEKGMSYSSCVSTCTCDIINESQKGMCKDNSCVEGCVATVCPVETVYTNKTLLECVSKAECKQIKCMKELRKHGSNCICINGKIECPVTTTSTTTVKPTTAPPKTESQIKLLTIFKNINELFKQIRNSNVLNGFSTKDKEILDTSSSYIKTIEKEALCYANLPNQSKCRCANEGPVCDPNDTVPIINHTQENVMEVQNKLDILEVIESHLKCLLNVEKGCVCITGQKVCKHDPPTSRKLIYSYVVNGEKHVVKYFYYLEKAKTTLNCLSHIKKMPYGDMCTCEGSQMVCSLDKPDGRKKENEEKTKSLNQYVKDVEGRLQCYARLKLDSGHCWCEGSRKICLESHTTIPVDNKFEIIEHYLPTKLNINQAEIEFTEDVECVKTLTDNKCSCIDGKKICPDTTTTPAPVTPTKKPIASPETELQIKFLAIFKNINALFEQTRNSNVLNGLSSKDKQILDTLARYIKTIEKETLCYANLPDQSKCRCENEGQVCDPNDTINYTQENLTEIQNKLDILEVIESHLKCLLNIEKGCVCITGQKVCKYDTPTSRKLIYPYFVDGEKHVVKYFYYLEKAKTTLNCLSHIKEVPYGDMCTCQGNQLVCSIYNPDGRKKENVEKTELLNQYVKYVEGRLQCYARLKLDSGHCWCEGSRKICLQSHTPIPADNKFEIIEQYLPTVVNINQIEIDYTKDVECVKTLTDHKCSCVDEKKVCPDTTTTPVPVTTTKKPIASPETELQIKFLAIFKNIKALFEQTRNSNVLNGLSGKDRQILDTWSRYMKTIEKETLCYANLPEQSKCRCENEGQVCDPNDTINYRQENVVEVQNKLNILEVIESHLKCLLNIEKGCVCITGQKVCKYDNSTSRKLIYPYFVNGEKHVVKYFYYLEKAKSTLNCLSHIKKMPYGDMCTCQDNQMICSLDKPDGRKKENVEKTELLNQYVKYVEGRLQCYARLKLDSGHCWCEGSKKICLESHTPIPADNKFEVIEQYLPTVVNINQIEIDYTKDVECVKTLTDHKCSCVDGKKVCPDTITTPVSVTTTKIPIADTTTTPLPATTTKKTIVSADDLIEDERLSKIQIKLLNAFSHVEELLGNFEDTDIVVDLTPKELQTVNVFRDYFNEYEADINCLLILPEFGKCMCHNGFETCVQEKTEEHFARNNIQMNNYLVIIENIEAQLNCLISKVTENPTCVCLSGHTICPDNINAPSRTKISYDNVIPNDEYRILSYYFINYAKRELKCLTTAVDLTTTTCSQGKLITTNLSQDPNEVKAMNAKKISTYTAYLNTMQEQVLCYSRLEHHTCRCEKGKQICEDINVIPENNNFAIAEKYVQTPFNKKQIYEMFNNDIKCLQSLGESDLQCTCENGKKKCIKDAIIDVEPGDKKLLDQVFTVAHDVTNRVVCLTNRKAECDNEYSISVPSKEKLQLKVYEPYITFIKTQLNCMKNKPETCKCVKGKQICPGDVSKWEELTEVELYREFLEHLNAQISCLLRVRRKSVPCFCVSGQEICEKRSYVLYPMFDRKVLIERNTDRLNSYIVKQLECFKSIDDKLIPCACKNGKKQCERQDDAQTTKQKKKIDQDIIKIDNIYPVRPTDHYSELKIRIPFEIEKIRKVNSKILCLVEHGAENSCSKTWALSLPSYQEIRKIVTIKDKGLLLTYSNIYIPYILEEMECVKNSPENCVCFQGRKICDTESTTKNVRDTAANHFVLYAHFITYVDSQLNCLTTLKPNGEFCMCGVDKRCDSTSKLYRLVQLISLDSPTDDDKKMMHTFVYERIRCLAYLKDRSGKCTCGKGGLEICTALNHELPITNMKNESTCGVTECPPNTRLEKKCPTCCPTCVQQFCVITLNGITVTKEPGEKWSEGKCEQCRCLEDEDGFYASCRRKQCNFIRDADIEYKVTEQEGECCPVFTPIGCKHDGKVYNLDSMIQRSSCETISCSRDADGTVIKKIDRTICDITCPLGSEYKKATDQCCGTCEQIGCVVGGKLKLEGSTWLAEGCLQYSCKKSHGLFFVTKENQNC